MTSTLAWLRPPPVTVPDGVLPADVGAVAWQVLLHDGTLRPVWGAVATPADRAATPAVRAAALRPLVPPRAVIGWAAAVWVHTGGPVPNRFDVLVEPRARRPSPHPLRVPHESSLPAGDVVPLGDVRVTTVERTARDVARWVGREDAVPLLRRLADNAGLDVAAVARSLGATAGQRFTERARETLAEAQRDVGAEAERAGVREGGQVVRPPDALAGTPAALEPVIR